MLNVLYVGRDKDTKVRKLASSAFTKKATSKGSSAKLHKNSVLKYGHKSHILELWDLFRVIALLHQKWRSEGQVPEIMFYLEHTSSEQKM